MKLKRLMFYINTLSTGGAERVISQLANRFSDDGYQVTLVTSFPMDNEYPLLEKVERVNLENEELHQSRFSRNISRIKKLRKLCRSYRPDVLISFMQEPNFRAILSTIGLPVKTIVSVRNDPAREYAGRLGHLVGKYVLPMADGCVFQTEQAKQWFPKKLQNKSTIIFNEVSTAFFDTMRAKQPKHIVAVGRLSEQKNHPMLIRAFARIAEKYPEQNLLIYGEGDCRSKLQELIDELGLAKRIYLMGSTSQVANVLSTAAVFVLSSNYEGMPNALMEALAVGVPSISTDCPCGGPNALIEHEKNGLLIPLGDEKELVLSLDRLLSDASFAQRLGQAAQNSAERYMPKVVFESWKSYIHTIYEKR